MRRLSLLLLLAWGCQAAEPSFSMAPIGKIRQALTGIDDVQAEAQLVLRGGDRLAAQSLTRGDDGVSFSGFIEAAPGDYTLEIKFTGVPMDARVFLGRYTSDAFTIATGVQVTPQFSRPLDTIGRPEDMGDEDQDGFGLLDEVLWGTDLSLSDTDGDGVADGRDCDPKNESRAFEIAPEGSIEDCDADGEPRPDLPYEPFGGSGEDCNDRDASVNPGATDDCANPVDQDCNPATCPINDQEAPSISMVSPQADAAVGCHTQVRATVTDNGQLASVFLKIGNIASGALDQLLMENVEGDVFEAPPFNLASGIDGLNTGQQTIEIEATDFDGNRSTFPLPYDFRYELPVLTSLTPAEVGQRDAPFTLNVEATAPSGVQEISLYAVGRNGMGLFSLSDTTLLGAEAGGQAAFNVDPANFSPGEYLLYTVVEDMLGNKLQPELIAVPFADPPGSSNLTTTADLRCEVMQTAPKFPVRVMTVNEPGMTSSPRMRELIDEALTAAAASDPGAQLVSVIGFGIEPDGTIGLDDAASFVRWTFGFLNVGTQERLSVNWFSSAFGMGRDPVVDPTGSGVTADEPIADASGLIDSDVVMSVYGADPNCVAPTGNASDFISYTFSGAQDTVNINSGGTFMSMTATGMPTVIVACQ